MAFSPDGHTLASGSSGGTVRLWDVADPAHPRPLGRPLTSRAGVAAASVAFSPAGHTLASGSLDGTVRLWDVADPAHPRPLGRAPDRRRYRRGGGVQPRRAARWPAAAPAVRSGCGMWPIRRTPARSAEPLTGGTAVVAVAFSPGGQTLASGSADGTVRLWDVADPAHTRPLGQPLTVSTAAAGSLAFSSDGHTLASSSADGAVRLWNLNVQYAIQRICAAAGGLTPQQWNQYVPQLHYQASCVH